MAAKFLGGEQAFLTQLKAESDKFPPEWPAINGDYVQTALKGVVKDGHLSRTDNPFNHSHIRGGINQAAINGIRSWIAAHYPVEEAGGGGGPTFCPSDYDLYVIPLRGWRGVLGGDDPSRPLIGPRDNVPVEWEDYERYTNYRKASIFDPLPGDLVFVSGRWIVDCGHTWKTEIHPPSVVVWMRHANYEGRDATVANVWVTGWYSGTYPVEFLVYPPPRPSPRATLRSVGQGFGATEITASRITRTDVIVTTTTGTNAIRLRVSAPLRQPEVTGPPWVSQGNMKWLDNPWRDFVGRYWVLWSEH